jgi:hypothetical protein
MDILDTFFKKYAYRFDKGYPDMDNKEDVLLLETLLSEVLGEKMILHEEVPNRPSTIKAVKKIIDTVGSKYNLSAVKSKPNRLSAPNVKDPSKFIEFFKETFGDDIEIKTYGPLKGPNPSGKFTLFQFTAGEFGEVNIIGSYSAPGGAGKTNEAKFIDNINDLITQAEGPVTIKMVSPEYTETFNNITQAVDSSKTGASKGAKSDAQLLSGDKVVANISLKQDGAFRWASVASNYPEFIKTFQDKALNGEIKGFGLTRNPDVPGKYLMYNPDTGERITKVSIPDFIERDSEMETFIFGPENPKVIVVGKTWKDADFNLERTTLTIQTTHIYKSLSDIKDRDITPVFTIAQHQGKPIGLDYRMYPANMVKVGPRGRAIELSKKEILK